MTTVGNVLRYVEHHRAGPASRRHREGAAHELGDALNRLDADQVLRGGAQDLHLPRLLGHVLPGVIARWLSPVTSTSGVPAFSASTMPVSRLVAPGPNVASHTPTRPLTLA